MRFQGTLTTWDEARGFGFIAPTQGGQDIFVHIKAFGRGVRPAVQQAVTFEVELGPQGRKRAKAVQVLRPAVRPRAPARGRGGQPAAWSPAARLAIPLFALVVLAVASLWPMRWAVGAVYGGMSLVTFMAYAFDKSAAVAGESRTSERSLLLLGLACGWPGGLLAQQLLRHKSSKLSFRQKFWASVALNVAAFVLLHAPVGQPVWRACRADGGRPCPPFARRAPPGSAPAAPASQLRHIRAGSPCYSAFALTAAGAVAC